MMSKVRSMESAWFQQHAAAATLADEWIEKLKIIVLDSVSNAVI